MLLQFLFFFFFFFFKQKTAYEMVSCDWSSDVCSSDLRGLRPPDRDRHLLARGARRRDPQAGAHVRDRAGPQQRRRLVYAHPAATRGAARAGLRDASPRLRRGREDGPAPGRKLRRRAAGDRPDERELRTVLAWRRNGAIHSGRHVAERLFRPRTGPRHRASQDPPRPPVRRDPEQRSPACVPVLTPCPPLPSGEETKG